MLKNIFFKVISQCVALIDGIAIACNHTNKVAHSPKTNIAPEN